MDLDALLDEGWARQENGDASAAEAIFRRAITVEPEHADAWCLLGMARQVQGNHAGAESAYRSALDLRPDSAAFHCNLGHLLTERGEPGESAARCREAIALDPTMAEAHNNLGVALLAQDEPEQALAPLARAIELAPVRASYHANYGTALCRLARYDEALACAETAIRLQPAEVEAHLLRSFVWLLRGDMARGWRESEWRWCSTSRIDRWYRYRPLDSIWDGSQLADKHLLIWGEQGVGDELMFAQMYHDAIGEAQRTTLECDPRLVPLFARSFPGAEVIPRRSTSTAALPSTQHDVHCPAGSLAQFLRTHESHFAATPSPYIVADPGRTNLLRAKYDKLGPGLKVGISWRSKRYEPLTGLRRSTNLDEWARLFDVPSIVWVNLQYGDCDDELETLREQGIVDVYQDRDVDPLLDMDGFAAQIAALDLVVSIDNSTVHMAGALGAQVWTLLPHVADRRWMADREDSPWYPSMRLFRQSEAGDWSALFDRIGETLRLRVAGCKRICAERQNY